MAAMQSDLFAPASGFAEGLRYAEDFLTPPQERELLAHLAALEFREAEYKEWRARRRIVAFGGRYDFSRNVLTEAPPLPQFLYPLRAQAAAWAGIPFQQLQHAMVAEYRAATPLGWHRDVPQFEEIIGVSLLGHARMRLRPWPPRPGERSRCALELAPRSVYVLRGAARWSWQHAISPTKELRYSITFRTRAAAQARPTG